MTLKTSKLRDAIAYALVVGATGFVGSAFAQQAEQAQTTQEQSATELDTIVVTGTRIQSQTMTASSPVLEINAEEFGFVGATVAEDLVNQYPQLAPVFDNFQNNPFQGYATVDLRGLGANRTLALVNGRRIPKGLGETADISIVPPALVQRVDVLTGGASAVYGSDAVAGVVNFILDNEFEGVSLDFGWSAYQHENDNRYMQGLLDEAGFDYPDGSSGFEGMAQNIDFAIGGRFGEGGHAVAWATYRKSRSLFQGQRDYSSCALSDDGTACGGSPTADPANFYVYSFNPEGDLTYLGYADRNPDGSWTDFGATPPNLYNFAPINYYQRPDTRVTAGTSVSYEINEHFEPYVEAMFVNRKSTSQIAPSGAFFAGINVGCDFEQIGSLCSDVGIGADDDVTILVAKRNVEGGPRITDLESTNYSVTTGVRGALDENWKYDAAFTYGRSQTSLIGTNDFLTPRIQDALLGCPDGSFPGCIPYEVWTDSVTPEQAQSLQGVSLERYVTDIMVFNGFVTGDLGFGVPWVEDDISVVAGVEYRKERYSFVADQNTAEGNFAGSGATAPPIDGDYSIEEVFLEANIPLLQDVGFLKSLDTQLGYRYSDYDTSGAVETFKVGFGANFNDMFRARAGFNRAIRGPNVNELFSSQSLGLWAGTDPCAGASPVFTAEQCARTGVSAAQYGAVPANSAGQYNGIFGGNPLVEPEEADTWTVGFAVTPIDNLDLSVDYYDIQLDKQISTLDPSTIINLCANGQDAFCDQIVRNPVSGDLFRGTNSFVVSTINNNGERQLRGIDLTANYDFDLGPGRFNLSFIGTHVLEDYFEPVPGEEESSYECAGIVASICQDPEWRHIAGARYSFDRFTVGGRWRYIGELDYDSPYTGEPESTDLLLCSPSTDAACFGDGGIDAFNYIDLYGSIDFGDYVTWNFGVNNVADKEPPLVGGSLVLNGNSIGGYDQAGRYVHTSISLRF